MAIRVIFQRRRHSGRQAHLFSLPGCSRLDRQRSWLLHSWAQIEIFIWEEEKYSCCWCWLPSMPSEAPSWVLLLLVHRMLRLANCPLRLILAVFCFVRVMTSRLRGRLIPEGLQRQTILSAHFWVILVTMTQAAQNTVLFEVLPTVKENCKHRVLKIDCFGWSFPSEPKARTEDITARVEQLTMIVVGWSHRKHHTPPAPLPFDGSLSFYELVEVINKASVTSFWIAGSKEYLKAYLSTQRGKFPTILWRDARGPLVGWKEGGLWC